MNLATVNDRETSVRDQPTGRIVLLQPVLKKISLRIVLPQYHAAA
jgi:hypothetical protein